MANNSETLTPIDTSSLVDKVYDYLLKRIIEGEVKYGETLNIKILADELQVSTMPVREALKRLEYERIIEIKPRSSCQIRIPTKPEIHDIYELREVLELFAIRKYKEHSDVSKLKRLREITEKMKEVDKESNEEVRTKAAISLDRQFHAEICKLADNNYLNGVYRHLNLHLNMTMIHEKSYNPLRQVYFQSHAEILKCLEREDNAEEMELCVRSHFDNVKSYLF